MMYVLTTTTRVSDKYSVIQYKSTRDIIKNYHTFKLLKSFHVNIINNFKFCAVPNYNLEFTF